jgi:hypothetical protein
MPNKSRRNPWKKRLLVVRFSYWKILGGKSREIRLWGACVFHPALRVWVSAVVLWFVWNSWENPETEWIIIISPLSLWVSEVLFLHGKTWCQTVWKCLRSPMPPAAIHPYPMKARVWIKHSRPSADADVEICKEQSCSLKHFKTKGSHLSMDHRLSVTWSFTAGFSHQEWGWWPKLMFTPYVYICVYIYICICIICKHKVLNHRICLYIIYIYSNTYTNYISIHYTNSCGKIRS